MAKALKNRLLDLLAEASGVVRRKLGAAGAYRCKGKTFAEVVALMEAALPPGGEDVLNAIADQMLLVESQGPRTDHKGEQYRWSHGFMEWIWQLQDGIATLPEVIPLEVLTAWRDGFTDWGDTARIRAAVEAMERVAKHCPDPASRCKDCRLSVWCCEKQSKEKPTYTTPTPNCRCEDCRMVLPNAEGCGLECPVCGSSKISPADLSKPGWVFPKWPAQFVGQTIFRPNRG